jgi:hypothetical protein
MPTKGTVVDSITAIYSTSIREGDATGLLQYTMSLPYGSAIGAWFLFSDPQSTTNTHGRNEHVPCLDIIIQIKDVNFELNEAIERHRVELLIVSSHGYSEGGRVQWHWKIRTISAQSTFGNLAQRHHEFHQPKNHEKHDASSLLTTVFFFWQFHNSCQTTSSFFTADSSQQLFYSSHLIVAFPQLTAEPNILKRASIK